MLKLIGESGAMVALISQLKDFTIESDLITADKLIHFLLPKSAILRTLLQQELFLQSSTDEYVIKEINYSDEDFYEVFGKLNLDSLHGKAYLTIEIESGTLDATLASVLAGTGWTYQLVDANTKLRTIKLTNVSVYQIVLECCAVYGCEVWFDTLGKTARFYTKRGMDRGAYVYNDLNLKDRDYQSDTYDLATRLYPIGKNGLSITSVNGGKEYIDNHQFTSKIIERKWIDERYTNAQSLYDDAISVLEVISKPRVSFRMDVLNLIGSRSEYAILDFRLGDTVRIFDKANQFADTQRIVRLVEYPLTPEKNKADFSNSPIKYSGNNSKQIADLGQILSGTKAELNLAIDQVTALVMNGESGNVVMRYDEQNQPYEILIMNTADINTATRVWRWNMSGLSYSASGYEGPYTTAITMDGQIVANFITTGTLSADRIAAHSLTADKLAAGTITAESGVIADLAVTTAKIAIGAITSALIETGAVATAQIADGSITDAKIVGLTANKITAGTIDAANINVINLNASNLTVGTINGQQISDGAVSTEKIATSAITTEKVALGAISATLIAAEAITGDKIVASAITGDKIAASTITANNLVTGTITAASGILADAAITTAKIGDLAVTSAKIDSLDAGKITTGTLDAARIAADSITANKLNVLAKNLINNYSVTTDLTGWTYGSGLFYSTTRNSYYHDITSDGNLQVTSSVFEINPTSNYRVTVSLYCASTIGSRYFGIYCYDKDMVRISVTPFSVSSRSFGADTNNPYFRSQSGTHSWLEMEGYVMGYNAEANDFPEGKNVTSHFKLPSNAKYMSIRYLNYYGDGTSVTAYAWSPTVTEIDSGMIRAENVVAGTLKSTNNYSWINMNDGEFSFGNGALAWNGSSLTAKGRFETSGTTQSIIMDGGSVRLINSGTELGYLSIQTSSPSGPWLTAASAATTIRLAKLVGTTLYDAYKIQFASASSSSSTHYFSGPIYEQGTALSSKYAAASHNHSSLTTGGAWNTLYTGYGNIQFGPANTSYAHIYTDRPYFYFNKEIYINGTLVSKNGHTHSYLPLTGGTVSGALSLSSTLTVASTATFNGTMQTDYSASGHRIQFGNYASGGSGTEPTMRPSGSGGYGFVGQDSSYRFYRGYCSSWVSTSSLEFKENLHEFDSNEAYELIKSMPVYAYRHKGKENIQLGVLVEDSPLEILNVDSYGADQKSVDLYSFTAMTLAAVQMMQEKVEALEAKLAALEGVA